MIIVSQDKDKIINFDNVTLIEIDTTNNSITYYFGTQRGRLGIYSTYERAREIFQEIIKFYDWCEYKKVITNINVMAASGHTDFVYEMPEE